MDSGGSPGYHSGASSPNGPTQHTGGYSMSTANSPAAIQAGSAVLKRYQRGRDRDKSLSESGFSSALKPTKGKENRNYDEDPSYFHAVADGSCLALQYSASKRMNMRGFLDSAVALDMSLAQEDDTTIELVRQVMAQLSSLTQEDSQEIASRLPDILASLQGIEQKLEANPSAGFHGKGERISFSPLHSQSRHQISSNALANNNKVDLSAISITDTTDNQPHTPVHDRSDSHRANPRSVLRVYMANQLDLNESEMGFYEDEINNLADKLLQEQDEKQELELNLKKQIQEKEEFQAEWNREKLMMEESHKKELLDMETAWDDDKQKFAKEMAALCEQVDDLKRVYADAQNFLKHEEEKNHALTAELERTNSKLTDDEEKLKHRELELDAARQQVIALQNDVTETQRAYEEFSNNTRIELDDLRNQIATLQQDCEDKANSLRLEIDEKEGLRAENEDLQAENEGLRAEKEDLQAENEGLQAEKDGLQDEIEELRSTESFLRIQVSQLQAKALELEEQRETSLRSMEDDHRRILEEMQEKYNNDYKTWEATNDDMKKLISQLETRAALADESQAALKNAEEELKALTLDRDDLKTKLEQLQTDHVLNASTDRIARLTQEVQEMDAELKQKTKEYTNLQEQHLRERESTMHMRDRLEEMEKQLQYEKNERERREGESKVEMERLKGELDRAQSQATEAQNSFRLQKQQPHGNRQELVSATEDLATDDNDNDDIIGTSSRIERSVDISGGHNSRSVLKVYMDNQLDLNKSELEHWEMQLNQLAETVQDLREKLETAQNERDDAREALQHLEVELENEKDTAESKLDLLQDELRKKETELQQCNDIFQEMRIKIEDKERIIDGLIVERTKLTDRIIMMEGDDEDNAGTGTSSSNVDLRSQLYEAESKLREFVQILEEKEEELQAKEAELEGKCLELAATEDALNDITSRFEQSRADMMSKLEQSRLDRTRNQTTLTVDRSAVMGGGVAGADPRDSSRNNMVMSTPSWDADDFARGAPTSMLDDSHTLEGLMSQTQTHNNTANFSVNYGTDVTELHRLLQKKEQQIRAQISQLELLQDSLAEAKAYNATLKQHKKGLKELVESQKKQAFDFQAEKNRADEALQQLESTKRELASTQGALLTAQGSINELARQLASTQRLSDKFEEVTLSPMASSAADILTPTKSRRGNNNEINAELIEAIRARDELHIENEKIANRLDLKTQRVDELSMEVKRLREELETRIRDLDNLRLKDTEEYDKAQAQILNMDRTIDELQELVQLQDAKCADLETLLRDRDIRLEEAQSMMQKLEIDLMVEKDVGANLRELLAKLGEKEDTTENLLDVVKDERDELAVELQSITKELQGRSESLQAAEEEIRYLQQKLADSELAYQEEKRDYETRRLEIESQLVVVKLQLESMNGEVESNVEVLTRRISDLNMEKAAAERSLHAKSQESQALERELEVMKASFRQNQFAIQNVGEIVKHFQSRLAQQEDFLHKQLEVRFSHFDARLSEAKKSLYSATSRLYQQQLQTGHGKKTIEQLTQALAEAETALKRAQEEADANENELLAQLNESRRDRDDLERSLDLRNEQEMLSRSNVVQSEEMIRLTERLAAMEMQTVEITSNSAKAFAQSSRKIAHLEGECMRLKSLLDHFRLVNAKLTGDVKAANEECSRTKSLDHRLKVAVHTETSLLERIKVLEAQVHSKDLDMLVFLRKSQEQEDKRSEEFEQELGKMREKLKVEHEKYMEANKSSQALREHTEELVHQHSLEMQLLQEQLNAAKNDVSAHVRRLEECDSIASSLKKNLRDKEDALAEYEAKFSSQLHHSSVTLDEWQRKRLQLESEIREYERQVRDLEQQNASLKKQLSEVEASNLLKDEVIASSASKAAVISNEARTLRAQCDAKQGELLMLTRSNEELLASLSDSKRDLDVLTKEYTEMKNVTHKQVVTRLADVEDQLENLRYEAENLRIELKSTSDECGSLQAELSAANKRIASLNEDIAVITKRETGIRENLECSQMDNQNLRMQLDDTVKKLSHESQELVQAQITQSEQASKIESMTNRIHELEMTCNSRMEELASADQVADSLAMDMKSFADALVTSTAVAAKSLVDAMGGGKNMAIELLTVPPFASDKLTTDELTNLLLNKSPTENGTIERSGSFRRMRDTFHSLKANCEAILMYNSKLREAINVSSVEYDDMKKQLANTESNLVSISSQRDSLQSRLTSTEEEISSLRREYATMSQQQTMVMTSVDSYLNSMLSVLRKIDGASAQLSIPAPGKQIPTRAAFEYSSSTAQERLISLNSAAREVEFTVDTLCKVIETLVYDASSSKANLDSSTADNRSLREQIMGLKEELNATRNELNRTQSNAEMSKKEVGKLKVLLDEFARNKSDLESEIRSATENNSELRASLADAENLCMDQANRIRHLQNETQRKADEIQSLSDTMEGMRRKITEGELLLEKVNASLGRVSSEKDAIDNILRSLELELERSRTEISTLKSQFSDDSTSFELEKLLAALGTTLDHLNTTLINPSQGNGSENLPSEPKIASTSSASSQSKDNADVAERVEASVKRLGDLRAWSRKESRTRRTLEERLEAVQQDLAAAHSTTEEAQRQLKKAMQSTAERDSALHEKIREFTDLQADLSKRADEISKLHRELTISNDLLEDERRARQKLAALIHTKEGESSKLKLDVDSSKDQVNKLQQQLNQLREKNAELVAEAEQRSEQIRTFKAANTRLSTTLEELQKVVEKDKAERFELEKRAAESESQQGVYTRLKSQVIELEASLRSAKQLTDTCNSEKTLLETSLQQAQREVESFKRKVTSLESRIDVLQKEKAASIEGVSELRSNLAKTKERLEAELSQRLRTEASLEASQKQQQQLAASNASSSLSLLPTTSSLRSHVEDTVTHNEGGKELIATLQQEIKALRTSLQTVSKERDDKEVLRASEAAVRNKLEQDVAKLKNICEKANRELVQASERASALRAEGRKAKKQIQDCIGQMREVVNIVRADASTVGAVIQSPMKPSSSAASASASAREASASGSGAAGESTTGMSEALGIDDLITALSALKEVVVWLREAPKVRVEVERKVRDLEAEKSLLEGKLTEAALQSSQRLNKMRQEVQRLQAIVDTREISAAVATTTSTSSSASAMQLSLLESTIQFERNEKQRALGDVVNFREQLDAVQKELQSLKASSAAQKTASGTMQSNDSDIKQVRRELAATELELKASNHHRSILRDTIDQLERQLHAKYDVSNEPTTDGVGTSDDVDRLRRQIARNKARISALEELVDTYRSSVMALHTFEGANSAAAAFGGLGHHRRGGTVDGGKEGKREGMWSNWIEREISSIRRTYEDEIRSLEAELNELRGKYTHSNSYTQELRKRFEDSMKALYRPNSTSSASSTSSHPPVDVLIHQLEHLTASCNSAEAAALRSSDMVASEKAASRRRHQGLVDSLSKALQAQDAAMAAVYRLESEWREGGREGINSDNKFLPVYESLKTEIASIQEGVRSVWEEGVDQRRVIGALSRQLVEVDHELLEAERRAKRRQQMSNVEGSSNRDRDRDREKEKEKEREREKEKERDRVRERVIERVNEERASYVDRHSHTLPASKASPMTLRTRSSLSTHHHPLTHGHSTQHQQQQQQQQQHYAQPTASHPSMPHSSTSSSTYASPYRSSSPTPFVVRHVPGSAVIEEPEFAPHSASQHRPSTPTATFSLTSVARGGGGGGGGKGGGSGGTLRVGKSTP